MAYTPFGQKVQDYINDELHRKLGSATVTERPNDGGTFDVVVSSKGNKPYTFEIEASAEGELLSDKIKSQITQHLDKALGGQ